MAGVVMVRIRLRQEPALLPPQLKRLLVHPAPAKTTTATDGFLSSEKRDPGAHG